MGWVNPRAITWARRQTVGSPTHKLVLLMLASACTSTSNCQVAIESLARDCELDERTVQRALRALAGRDLLTIHSRSIAGLSRANEYRLKVDTIKGGGDLPSQGDIAPPRDVAGAALTPALDTEQGWRSATPTSTTASFKKATQQQQLLNAGIALPASLPPKVRAAAQRLLARIPSDSRQTVADEWAARYRKGDLRIPLAYLAKLVAQFEAGLFSPELAAEERSRRQRENGAGEMVRGDDASASGAHSEQLNGLMQAFGRHLRRVS